MAIPLPDARQLSDRVLRALRLRAIRGCEMGLAHARVAALLGVARETVSRWWSAYQAQGLAGLPGDRTGRPVGVGRTLSESQGQHIQELLDAYLPDELGIACPLWTRRAVRDLIRREYGIHMPLRTVGDYLKRWGYTAKKPSRHARDQDADEVHEWLGQTYPEIERVARQEGATLWWVDETGVAADAHRGGGYARRGKRARLEVPDSHIRVNVMAAVSNTGTLRFMTYGPTMTGERFIGFLRRLLRSVPGKSYVIADRLPAHDAQVVRNWLAGHGERIEVILMPRRAPELNPVEYLNNDLKGEVTAEELPSTREQLRAQVSSFLRTLLHWPARVISYFFHPRVLYASGL